MYHRKFNAFIPKLPLGKSNCSSNASFAKLRKTLSFTAGLVTAFSFANSPQKNAQNYHHNHNRRQDERRGKTVGAAADA
jgi:hypothetical protein